MLIFFPSKKCFVAYSLDITDPRFLDSSLSKALWLERIVETKNWVVTNTKKKKNGLDVMIFYPVSCCISLLTIMGATNCGDEVIRSSKRHVEWRGMGNQLLSFNGSGLLFLFNS